MAANQAKRFLMNINIFSAIPIYYLTQIMMKMTLNIHLPNDVVSKGTSKVKFIHVIYSGTVALYVRKELSHFYDLDYFGDIFLSHINGVMIAVDHCKIYKITYKDIEDILDPFPDILSKILHYINDVAIESNKDLSKKSKHEEQHIQEE